MNAEERSADRARIGRVVATQLLDMRCEVGDETKERVFDVELVALAVRLEPRARIVLRQLAEELEGLRREVTQEDAPVTLTREVIIAAFRAALEPRADVSALSEAGSAAFGALDQYSDIDLSVDVADGSEDAVWDAIEEMLRGLAPIAHRFDIPQPSWHGMSQRFYRLEGTPEWLMLDVALRSTAKRGLFTERERHGDAIVFFDKDGATSPLPLDRTKLAEDREKRLAAIRAASPLLANLGRKEALRGRPLDAVAMYQSQLFRPLVDTLRSRYCPDRWDYGLRYLYRDLPPEVHARLARLAFAVDLEDLKTKAAEAEQWLAEELAR